MSFGGRPGGWTNPPGFRTAPGPKPVMLLSPPQDVLNDEICGCSAKEHDCSVHSYWQWHVWTMQQLVMNTGHLLVAQATALLQPTALSLLVGPTASWTPTSDLPTPCRPMSGIVDEMVSRISGEADSYLPLKQGEAGAEQGVRCLAELPQACTARDAELCAPAATCPLACCAPAAKAVRAVALQASVWRCW